MHILYSVAESNSTSVRNNELVRYKVLAEVMLHKQQDDDTRRVTEALSVMPGVAELLLRHYRWSPQDVQSAWPGSPTSRTTSARSPVCQTRGAP